MTNNQKWTCSIAEEDVLIPPDSVQPEDFVRIVPVLWQGEVDRLSTKATGRRVKEQPPPRWEIVADWKVLPLADIWFDSAAHVTVSEAFLRALEAIGAQGWSARPVPHGTPNPVRGLRPHYLDLPGFMGKPAQGSELYVPPRFRDEPAPYGVGGWPVPPVTWDLSAWSGDQVGWSEWLATVSQPWRALIARGSFITALLEQGVAPSGLKLQSMTVVNLPSPAPRPQRPPGQWERAAKPWTGPAGDSSVMDRIFATAERFGHVTPAGASPADIAAAFTALQSPLPQTLATWMARSDGATLFDGALTFFPVHPRTAELPQPGLPNDTIVGANARVNPEDWFVTREPGWTLFAARPGESPSLWAIGPDERVRLLHQDGCVLGPDIPFIQWLEDQVADLEHAWEHRDELPFKDYVWLGG
jgi:hypothetical protein